MVKSMTGYGKAEAIINNVKYTVEIRSLNAKSADITLKTSLIPREKEMEVRQLIASRLNRGTIDLYITTEKSVAGATSSTLNKDIFNAYLNQVDEALKGTKWSAAASGEYSAALLGSVVRMPDVFETTKEDLSGDNWAPLFGAISTAVDMLDNFRTTEGASLRKDVLGNLESIESFIPMVEKFEAERVTAVRERIDARMAELALQVDKNRLEQEIIFYIDKLDINEEKVRLRQHCRYFRETLEGEEFPGKKLGFIAQEMGREINTLGSKANHAEIQKIVVKMKAELEKIKEQSMNIL
jgi:uncharacterized protein (TIGR00255 family)